MTKLRVWILSQGDYCFYIGSEFLSHQKHLSFHISYLVVVDRFNWRATTPSNSGLVALSHFLSNIAEAVQICIGVADDLQRSTFSFRVVFNRMTANHNLVFFQSHDKAAFV